MIYPRQTKRQRRGLVNGLGTIIKTITGNMDENDCMQINSEIEKISLNENELAFATNNQIKLNKEMIMRFENITSFINIQQNKINIHLNKFSVELFNEIDRAENILKYQQVLNQILYDIEYLNNHVKDIAQTINLSKLNIIPRNILIPEELDYSLNILIKQGLQINAIEEVYEYLNLQAYYNDTNIIFNFKIPIFYPENFQVNFIIPIPTPLKKSVNIFYNYALINGSRMYLLNNACPKINKIYICDNNAHNLIETSNDTCLRNILQNKSSFCSFINFSNQNQIKFILDEYLLLINCYNVKIETSCGIQERTFNGTILIKFYECSIKINEIIYENRKHQSYQDNFGVLPLQNLNINETKLTNQLSLETLESYHMQNLGEIQFVKTHGIIHITSNYLMTGIIIIALILLWKTILNFRNQSPINNAPPNEAKLLWSSLH